MLVIVKKE